MATRGTALTTRLLLTLLLPWGTHRTVQAQIPSPSPAPVPTTLLGLDCAQKQVLEAKLPPKVAIGRAIYQPIFAIDGNVHPGYLTCKLPSQQQPGQINLQFGLGDGDVPVTQATVTAFLDGQRWQSVTLTPKQAAQTWEMPVQRGSNVSLEVACRVPCQSRVYFTRADLAYPVAAVPNPESEASNSPNPDPESTTNPEAKSDRPKNSPNPIRQVENTLRILNLIRGLFGVF